MDKKNLDLKKWIFLISFTLLGYWIVNNLDSVGMLLSALFTILFPFILGVALAFIINIPMSFFERKMAKMKNKKLLRVISLIFAVLVISLVIALVINLIVPKLIDIVNLLIDNSPYYAEQIDSLMKGLEDNIPELSNINIDIENIKGQAINQIPSLLTMSLSIVSNVISAVSSFFIAVIFALYILIDKEKLQMQFTKLINAYLDKDKVQKLFNIGKTANTVFRKFFTVQFLEAMILGALCIIGMLILRIPYAVPIGILIGVTALIPVLGAFIGVGIGAILIVCINPMKVVTFVIFILILQQIEGNLIYPKVVGNRSGTSRNMGFGSRYCWRKSWRYSWNAYRCSNCDYNLYSGKK